MKPTTLKIKNKKPFHFRACFESSQIELRILITVGLKYYYYRKMRPSLQSDLPFDRLKKVLIKVAFADHIRFINIYF